jgi:hypothetical protein
MEPKHDQRSGSDEARDDLREWASSFATCHPGYSEGPDISDGLHKIVCVIGARSRGPSTSAHFGMTARSFELNADR